jgi:hypothetical protein
MYSSKYNQQDATLYNILYYCQCTTCFRRFLCPSSGVQKLYTQHWVYVKLAMVYSFVYMFESPFKETFHENGKNIRSPYTRSHVDRRPTYNGVRPGSTKGSFSTLLSLPQCHAVFSTIPSTLAWVDQSPVSQLGS